jgi:hypothetical protein
MNEKEIQIKINKYNPQPDKAWQERTLHILKNLPENVTEEQEIRIRNNRLFNFLNRTIVNVKLTTGIVIAASVILIGGSMVTVYASNDANPGDFLYPLDKAVESLQRTFISDPITKAEFEIQLMEERVLELKALSAANDAINSASAVGEVDAQQIRLQERLKEMDQLRIENKIQNQDQLKVLEQLKTQTRLNEQTMDQVQLELKMNGNSQTMNSLEQVQTKYSEQVVEQINGFEQSTGLTVQETEQNAGEETQIQNQNQIQNSPSSTPAEGNGNGNGSTQITPSSSQQQNGGTTQQGKN